MHNVGELVRELSKKFLQLQTLLEKENKRYSRSQDRILNIVNDTLIKIGL